LYTGICKRCENYENLLDWMKMKTKLFFS
jgi:hypothetical protein